MLFATRFRFYFLGLLVVSGGLASSCQSSRPSFAFQPMAHQGPATTPATVAAEILPRATVTEAPAKAPLSQTGAEPMTQKQPRKPSRPQRQAMVAEVANIIISAQPVTPIRKRSFLSRPQATAESGLGTTVLGVLGLIALPIALIGLALSGGGLVWAIVAGAAALAVLVAYIDPFGR